MSAHANAFPLHDTSPAAEQLLALGVKLGDSGRYVVEGIIAVGGMATVYKATDTRLNTVCAIKALFLPRVEQAAVDAFRAEAQILAAIHFDGIVAVRDYFHEADFAFLVMDYVEGENLYDRHRRTGRRGEDTENLPLSPAPEDLVAGYGLSLAAALDHLHSQNPPILYRDLKPHNVMRRASDGRLVLLDFGIARRLRKRGKQIDSDELGTPGYAALEQYDPDGILDARTDIYSLGVVLVELATGYNPRADDAPRTLPPLSALKRGLSPGLASALQQCIEPEPAKRFQSARELMDALEHWQTTPRRMRRKSEPIPAWEFSTNPATGPMVTVGSALYCVDAEGALHAVDMSTGGILAQRQGARRSDGSAPETARYSLSATPAGFVARTANFGISGARLTVYDGKLNSLTRMDAQFGRFYAAWMGDGARLAVAASNTTQEIACIAPDRSGSWRDEWRIKLDVEPAALAATDDGDLFTIDVQGALSRMSGEDGALVWRQLLTLNPATAARLLGDYAGTLIASCGSALIAVDSSSGNILWETSGVGRPLGAPLLSADRETLIVPTRDAGLSLLRHRDGRSIECAGEFPRAIVGAARLVEQTDILALAEYGAGARILLYDTQRRSMLWQQELGVIGAISAPVAAGDLFAVQEEGGRIAAWRWEDCS